MAVVIKGSGSIEGTSGLEMGANGTTEIRGQVNVAVGSSVSGVSTSTNFAPSSVPTSNRNLVINGAMEVAQRGTTSGTEGFNTIDRFSNEEGSCDEVPTQSQVAVASGTTPYELGFRKAFRVTNGNQTSGAQAANFIKLTTKLEAQDVATSGWNYKSSSSFVTLSFWVKSSVAQNFYGRLRSHDGTSQNYPYETGSLTADTWTKVTKIIPGNSNLAFNYDNGTGLELEWMMYRGGNTTASGVALDTWAAYASGTRTPDQTSTWFTTNDATFEITGIQLELGKQATPFEHEPYSQTLNKCLRYYEQFNSNGLTEAVFCSGYFESDTNGRFCLNYYQKRAQPTLSFSAASTFTCLNTNNIPAATAIATQKVTETSALITVTLPTVTSGDGRGCILISVSATEATIKVDAELS